MPHSTVTNVTARTVERCRHGAPIGWPWGRCGTCQPVAAIAGLAVAESDPEPQAAEW